MTNAIKPGICMIVIMILVAMTGCSSGPRVVASADGLCQLEIPGGWAKQTDLNDDANIQVANFSEEAYVIVISEYKIDFENDFTAVEYSDLTRQLVLDGLSSPEVTSGPSQETIGGLPARRYELRGTMDGMKLIYLHITVDGDRAFHQILAWTMPSKYDKAMPVMESVIDTFTELDA